MTDRPIEQVVEHLAGCGVDILEGPAIKAGAVGPLLSVYINDPDGNLVEIANQL